MRSTIEWLKKVPINISEAVCLSVVLATSPELSYRLNSASDSHISLRANLRGRGAV